MARIQACEPERKLKNAQEGCCARRDSKSDGSQRAPRPARTRRSEHLAFVRLLPCQLKNQLVVDVQWAHANWRTGQDDVTGLQ